MQIDPCPECGHETTDLLSPDGRVWAYRLFHHGVERDATFVLEPCGHTVTGSEIELRKARDFPESIKFHRA